MGTFLIDYKEIKKYIPDYGHNMFLEEQAKVDKIKEAFLTNCFDRRRALEVIKGFH